MKLLNVSFGKKLGGAFGFVLLMLTAIAVMSYVSTRNIAEKAHLADQANELALMLGEKVVDHLDWLNTLDRFLVQPEGKRLELQIDDHKCKLGQWLYGDGRKHTLERFPGLEASFTKLESPHNRLHVSAVQLKQIFKGNTDIEVALEKAHIIYAQETLPALKQIRGHLEAIKGELVKRAHDNSTQLVEVADTTQRNIVIVALIAISLAVSFGIFMTRYVATRVKKLMRFAETIAQGDFSTTMTDLGDDELGRLANALNLMRTKLGGLLSDFVSGVTHLSASSHELFGISKEMSDGSENMSESSITVAAAAEEMSANMNSVAAASEQAASNINMVAAAAEELTATVSEIAQSSETARGISEEAVSTASHASNRINELGTAASQISKVTEVITEISEQTNLLALNATIEAARAGEAGKGFAVVANEIKDLAKQTADATQDIKSEIEGMQNTTQSSVVEINQITDVINRVNDIVATIASAVEEQSATTNEIASNVAQASEGIQEVNVNVSQSASVASEIARDIAVVSQVSGDITNSSSTVSANAGDLSGFSAKLRDSVSDFRLPADLGDEPMRSNYDQADRKVPDLIRWNDNIKVNVTRFDDQHRQLVGMINKLHRAMKTGQAGSSIELILSELVDYTKTHFKAEEDLMRQHGFEGIAEQIQQHQELIQQVADAQEKISTGNATLSMDIMDFLKKWLVNHIQGEDKKYGPFFNAKGVS